MNNSRTIIVAALVLAVFSLAGTGLVSLTYSATKVRIAENKKAVLLDRLNTILPSQLYNNKILDDVLKVTDQESFGTNQPMIVYRARKQNKPVAAVLTTIAPDGYNGTIQLLVSILYDGTTAGVRVISHRETPGLGDAIEETRSDWIFNFNGRSLTNPKQKKWGVKRDGGDFDQFTGATVTPRAIVKAVYKSLLYFQKNRDQLFSIHQPPTNEGEKS